ncbi:hypothetical protein [Azospirillum endophyticum]
MEDGFQSVAMAQGNARKASLHRAKIVSKPGHGALTMRRRSLV